MSRVAGAGAGRAYRWLPGLEVVRSYRRGWLRHDLVAGLVLTTLLVPQGMAYAELAGLPPVTGLYATIAPLAAYALFGPSRILVLGPDSAVSPLVAAAVVPLAAGDASQAVALAGMLALLAGMLCLVGGSARLGFVADLLSKPVRLGYLNGIALVIIAGQLSKLAGVPVEARGVPRQLVDLVRGLDQANGATLAVGLSCLIVILALARWSPRLPGVLIAVVAATAATAVLDLGADGVSLVGPLPRGLPAPALPSIGWDETRNLIAAAFGIALVSFTDTSVLSRSYAGRLGERVDQNRELFALGAANVAAGLLQGFPVSSSSSRTPVAESAGARTQLTGLVAAVATGSMLVAAPGLLRNLPTAALAAVLIAAALRLADIESARRLYQVRPSEFWLCAASFLGVALLGVLPGTLLAVGLSLLNFVRRAWRPNDAVLGRVDGMKGYHDTSRYPHARRVPGLLLYRFDAPLFFANADYFRERVLHLAVEAEPRPRWVVVAAEPMTDVDATAADMLVELDDELAAAGVELAFAELKDPVRDRLARYGLTERFGPGHLFPTIGVAVHTYLDRSGVDYHDWTDPEPPVA